MIKKPSDTDGKIVSIVDFNLSREPLLAATKGKGAEITDASALPEINSLLPAAMVSYAVLGTRYNFAKEQRIWKMHTARLGVKRTFKDYFISIYSGQDPAIGNIQFASSEKVHAPLNEDGSFKSEDRRSRIVEMAKVNSKYNRLIASMY